MFLSIKEMEVRKIHFDESFAPGSIDVPEAGLRQVAPFRAEGTAELLPNSGNQVRVRGRFRGEIEAECDRCLQPARFALDQRFDLFYRPMRDLAVEEEVEIDEGEAEIAFYEGLGMELADIVKEQVLLALPMQHLCREECLGICPVCGGNRNEAICNCVVRPADDRWAALKNLTLKQ